MKYDEDKIIATVDTILNVSMDDLNDAEALLALSNCMLAIAEKHLPRELTNDSRKVLSDGRQVSYELLKHDDSVGLDVAFNVHRIITTVNQGLIDG